MYLPGRYFTGITGQFIVYPTTWYTIDYASGGDSSAIIAKTLTSSQVTLEVNLMYRLKIEYLHELWSRYPAKNQQRDMITTAKEVIQQTVNNYDIYDFFSKRELIADTMAYGISQQFKSLYYSEVTLFLLKTITLQDSFETQILNSLITVRQGQTASILSSVNVIQGQISNINSEAQIKINEVLANATVKAATDAASLRASGQSAILSARATALYNLKSTLNFTNDELNEFLYYDTIRQFGGANVYAGFTNNVAFSITP